MKAASCTETGYEEYWKCQTCGKLFSDEAGTDEIASLDDIQIPAKGHEEGNEWLSDAEKHWKECAVCQEKTEEADHVYVNETDTVCEICGYERTIKSEVPEILEGHNGKWQKNSGKTLSYRSSAPFAEIIIVTIDKDVVYEKNYEQSSKLGIPIEEVPIKNRFEIRLKNERAYYAVRELLTYYDAELTAFSINNQYIRFADKEANKRKSDWKTNARWSWFIGEGRPPVKLTTKPEPYTLQRTLNWLQRQVAPTLKMLKQIDAGNQTDYLKTIEQQAKLTDKHRRIVKQQTASVDELIKQEKE